MVVFAHGPAFGFLVYNNSRRGPTPTSYTRKPHRLPEPLLNPSPKRRPSIRTPTFETAVWGVSFCGWFSGESKRKNRCAIFGGSPQKETKTHKLWNLFLVRRCLFSYLSACYFSWPVFPTNSKSCVGGGSLAIARRADLSRRQGLAVVCLHGLGGGGLGSCWRRAKGCHHDLFCVCGFLPFLHRYGTFKKVVKKGVVLFSDMKGAF